MPEEIELEEEIQTEGDPKPKLPRKGEGKPPLPKKKSSGEGGGISLSDGTETTSPSKYQSQFPTAQEIGELSYVPKAPSVTTEEGIVLDVNPRVKPPVPYTSTEAYIGDLNQRIKAGRKTPQDEKFISNQRKANANFSEYDNYELSKLSGEYGVGNAAEDIDSKIGLIKELKKKVFDSEEAENPYMSASSEGAYIANRDDKYKDKMVLLDNLESKLALKKASDDTRKLYIDVDVRTDQSGNLLKKALSRVALMNPASAGAGNVAISQETEDRVERQPAEFSIGLNYLKYKEPEQYKRVTNMLEKGEPLSESMVANITAHGLEAKEVAIKDALTAGEISPEEFTKQSKELNDVRYNNIVGNKEVLRAFLASGVANTADDFEQKKGDFGGGSKVFGNRWNYTDEEIEKYGNAYAQANGIDPNDARVKDAVRYLQDNEGAMILQNSIAKSGWVRDFAKGLAQPIRGISNTIEDLGKSKSDVYTEGQSQGNVNVAEEKLNRLKTGWEGTISDVLEGTGQFLTQAGLAAATSGAIGGTGSAALGRAGQAALAWDIALADMSAGNIIGKTLLSSKDKLATFITAYGQSYDSNLKQALTYTADDGKAKLTANVLSGLEGATELFLSPLEIAQGIAGKLINKKKITKSVIDVLNDAAIVDKNAAVKNVLKSTLKGALETGKVGLAEIGEEEVTQIADYTANAMLNPNSKTFQDRDLAAEMANTAYQTGLSMAIPAIASGVGAYNVNNFSKGSLVVAAQNRQALIDDMNKRVFDGSMTQDEYNEKAQIINTAANANAVLPTKDDGKKLNSQEKANYIYSRVSEAVLNKQLQQLKEDKSRDVGKIGEGEDATKVEDPEITQLKKKIEKQIQYRSDILGTKGMYFADGERVDKKAFNEMLSEEKNAKRDLRVENDEKTQAKLDEFRKPKEPVIVEEESIAPPIEGLGELEEETVVESPKKPLESNLELAMAQAAEANEAPLVAETQAAPVQEPSTVTEAAKPPLQANLDAAREDNIHVEETVQPKMAAIPALNENLQAARSQGPVIDAEKIADERAKELLGDKAHKPSVPSKEENIEVVRQQQAKAELAEQEAASIANEKVAQMALDKIPMTENATKALAKMDKVKGKKLGVFRQLAKDNPKAFLKEVAQQAQGILANGEQDTKNAMKQAVSAFTKDTVDAALEMFPAKKTENKQSEFEKNVDKAADKIISALSPKWTGNETANGLTAESLIRGGAKIVKAAYRAGKDISKAIDEAVEFIKSKWDNTFGEFDEAEVIKQLNDLPQLRISEKNKKTLDKLVEGIANGTTNKTNVNKYISSLKLSDETKNRFKEYIKDEISELKKGTLEGLNETEKTFYDFYEDKFLNGEMSYEQVMHQLGSIADRQPTEELKEKYNNIRNIFFKENNKRAQKQEKAKDIKEDKNFAEDINETRLGLSDTELTILESDMRLLRDSSLTFMDDTSFLKDNDQLRAAFEFDQYAQDLNGLIGKFQVQYGEDYLKKMEAFVKDEKNQLDARVSVSVALNNHIKYLKEQTDNPLEKLKYQVIEESNARESQKLGSRASLVLNSLRAWNSDLISDLAWVGVVSPDLQSRADAIKQALGSEITDEDLIADEEGNIDIFEDEGTPTEQNEGKKKTASFFKKRAAKIAAKNTQVKPVEDLKKEVEEQKKKCK